MSVIDNVNTLLHTITPLTIITPEAPRMANVDDLPYVEIQNIVSSHGQYTLDGGKVLDIERIQLTMAASSYAALGILVSQVRALLDNNHTNFILSLPMGRDTGGNNSDPELYWCAYDWLILHN